LHDFFWILDEQGNILFANDYVVNRLHYSRAELYQMNVLLMHPQERREEATKIVGEMIQGITEYCPIPIQTKEGQYIPVETRVVQGKWNDKNTIFGVSKDISELKLSEEKFSKAFHTNSNLITISELESGKYLDVNQKFLELLNLKKEEVIGKSSVELNLFDKQLREIILVEFKKIGYLNDYELELNYNGQIIHGLFSVNYFYLQETKCIITVMQDITKRTADEQIIKQQNTELKKLNSDKDRFMSILAHDLRSPFTTILGFSELLLNNLNNFELKRIEHQINIIYQTTKKTFNLLEDLLLWSKSQSGKISYEPMKIGLNELCKEIVDSFESQLIAKELTLNYVDSPTTILYADYNMIRTILRNLLSNAIKFSYKHGFICIFSQQNQDNVTIIVSDNGVGIENENISRIWDFTNPLTTKGTLDEEGSGLGLVLCKEFVEKHSGTIWVESIVGKGSDFKFTLPLYKDDC